MRDEGWQVCGMTGVRDGEQHGLSCVGLVARPAQAKGGLLVGREGVWDEG